MSFYMLEVILITPTTVDKLSLPGNLWHFLNQYLSNFGSQFPTIDKQGQRLFGPEEYFHRINQSEEIIHRFEVKYFGIL